MNEYPNTVKEKLMSLIDVMSASPEQYVKNPSRDFTRNRKLSFGDVIKLMISMGGNSLRKELFEANRYELNTATTSAFIQQRDKILPSAFETLLRRFTQSHTNIKKYRGYRLLAADGSDVHAPTNPNDSDTFFQTKPDVKGYNLLLLNAMYDLCTRIYVDAIIQPGKGQDEVQAMIDMVDRSRIRDKVIVIADRYYESYNVFAHVERKNWNYLIRVKDLGSKGGILSGLSLPSGGEFDITLQRILSRSHTNAMKSHPEIYRRLANNSPFDFLDKHTNKFYPLTLRIVRFKITDDSYETVITNLGAEAFSSSEIKKLYNMRWGIETAFRELKYAVGLNNFHTKKKEHIIQEIFARMIMYNFAEMITAHAVILQSDTKHLYQVNFTMAIHLCRHFLSLWNHARPPDIESLIRKSILPVRPGRKARRKTRYRSAVSFIYRVA